jgi:rubredoxin
MSGKNGKHGKHGKHETPSDPPEGFFCPDCLVKLLVRVSRRRPGQEVRRIRRCPLCGLEFSTRERPETPLSVTNGAIPPPGGDFPQRVATKPL